jgi:hypothetical protein
VTKCILSVALTDDKSNQNEAFVIAQGFVNHYIYRENAQKAGKVSESQWRSGSASVSNARSSGYEPRQGQEFSSSYETPELLGAGDSHVLRMRR